MDPVDRPYAVLASAYAAAGRVDDAQRMMAEYVSFVPKGLQKGNATASGAEGDIAAAQGRPADAIGAYRRMRTEFGCPQCGLFEIATQFQKLNEPDSARIYFEAGLAAYGPQRAIVTDPVTLAASYQHLAQLYEAKGDRKKAIEYYLKLADLWKNADPELQPVVKDAHARVARLAAEH
jgi:tetratricopeptide (TPR) repeat protein